MLYYMSITADRKDIAKCSNFIECFEFDQIEQVLSSVGPVIIISRISMKPMHGKWILFTLF